MLLVYFASIDISLKSSERLSAQVKVEKAVLLLEELRNDIQNIKQNIYEKDISQNEKKRILSSYERLLQKYDTRLEQIRSDIVLISFQSRNPLKLNFNTNYENDSRFKNNSGQSDVFTGNMGLKIPIKNGTVFFSDNINFWTDSGACPRSHNFKGTLRKQFGEGVSSTYYLSFSPYRDSKSTSSWTDDYGGGVEFRTKKSDNTEVIIRNDYNDKRFLNNSDAGYNSNRFMFSINKPMLLNRFRISSHINSVKSNIDYGVLMKFTHKINNLLTFTYADKIQFKRFYSEKTQNFKKNDFTIGMNRIFSGTKRLTLRSGLVTDKRPNFSEGNETVIRISSSWYDRVNTRFNYSLNFRYLNRDINSSSSDYNRFSFGTHGKWKINAVHSLSLNPQLSFAGYDNKISSYKEQLLDLSWDMRLRKEERIRFSNKFNNHIRTKDKDKSYMKINTGVSWFFSPYRQLSLRLSAGYEQFLPDKSTELNSRYNAVTGAVRYNWTINDLWKLEGFFRYRERNADKNDAGDAGDFITSVGLQYNY